jgi:drug/metabolite transporter (DMT)-like permease
MPQWVFGALAVYVITGTLQPTITDLISYGGGTGSVHDRGPPMMLPVLASTLGMALVHPLTRLATTLREARQCGVHRMALPGTPSRRAKASASAGGGGLLQSLLQCGIGARCKASPQLFVRLLSVGAIDLVSGVLLTAGLLRVGSAVYVVVYSSNTLWTALISRCRPGGRQLGRARWLAVATLTLGLLVNAWATSREAARGLAAAQQQRQHRQRHNHALALSAKASAVAAAGRADAALGTLLLLAGTLVHSLVFVVSEALIEGGLGGHELCSAIGGLETVVLVAYNAALLVTRPEVSAALVVAVRSKGAVAQVLAGYAALVVTNMLHAAVFFKLLGEFGAVGAAVMKGVQTVLVFTIGATYFCHAHADVRQCATPATVFSMLLVLGGLLGFAANPPAPPAGKAAGKATAARSEAD